MESEGELSAEATGWVWKNSPYRGAELLIHLAIADVVNDAHGNEFWMTSEGVAAKTRLSRSAVFSALGRMVEDGLLDVVERGGGKGMPTRYRFIQKTVQRVDQTVQTKGLNSPDGGPRTKELNELKDQKETVQNLDALGPRTRAPWQRAGTSRETWAAKQEQPALSVVPDSGVGA